MRFIHMDEKQPPKNVADPEWSKRVLVWLETKETFRSGYYNFRVQQWTLENCSCTEQPVWWMDIEKPNSI